ncbi:MAG TPA: MBG domain-containing protein, partial [Clostridia bacterium]|nr:MBG domain-containing protein [Clostridia bacterium]
MKQSFSRKVLAAAIITLVLAGQGARAADFYLRAAAVTNALPDGATVVMWGFAQEGFFGSETGKVTVPGPLLTVPSGDTVLNVHVDNRLPEAVSIVIPGQRSAVRGLERNDDGRARSFARETPGMNTAPVTYSWTNLSEGTYIYHSGSHAAVQVQMGLYGAVVRPALTSGSENEAYPGIPFDRELLVFYSEIDADLHAAVATNGYGKGKGIQSTIRSRPSYYLVNGQPYTNGVPPLGAFSDGETVLLRFCNVSMDAHSPVLDGHFLRLVAEDGKPYAYPRETYVVDLPAMKTVDAIFLPKDPGLFALYDRRLGFANSSTSFGGMLAHISVALLPPVITAQPTNQYGILGGGASFSVTAQGSAPLFYQWYLNGTTPLEGETNRTLSLTGLEAADFGGYSVVVSNSVASVTSDTAILTLVELPTITQQPLSQMVAAGSNVTFEVVATSLGPTGYQWYHNKTNLLVGELSPTLVLTNVQLAATGDYTVVVTNLAGQVESAPAGLIVVQPPVITLFPSDQIVPAGGTAIFAVNAESAGPLSFEWYYNDTTLLPGATTNTLILSAVQLADAGKYSVKVTNIAGSVVASAMLVVVLPPLIVAPPVSQIVNESSNVVFHVNASSLGPMTYTWLLNGTPVPNAITDTLMIPAVKTNDAGTYTVQVHNVAGSGVAFAELAVVVPPTNTTAVTFTDAAFHVGTFHSSVPGYEWFFLGQPLAGETAHTLTITNVTPTNAGMYSVVVTTAFGSLTNSAELTVLKAFGTVELQNLTQMYDGNAKPVLAVTTPPDLAVNITYDGNADAPTNAGTYEVIATINDLNYAGGATNTLTVLKASGTVELQNLTQVYDGNAKPVLAVTIPPDLAVNIIYDGNADAPTNAGTYEVIATINDLNYAGGTTNTLTVLKASGTVELQNLTQVYDGNAKPVLAVTIPPDLAVNIIYDGNADAPTNTGTYEVIATINDLNYAGGVTNTLTVLKASGTVELQNLTQVYDGNAKPVLAVTTPPDLAVGITYDGNADAPTNAGTYEVIATINELNYAGGATNTLTVFKASGTVELANLTQVYDGNAKPVLAVTTPPDLAVNTTYDGNADAPTNAGTYEVIAT